MARLVFYRGENKLVEYRLPPGRTSIGRSDGCDVALPGGEISRTHCLVERRGSEVHVMDRSRHGITVDGEQVSRALLTEGAEIGMGPYRVQLQLKADVPEPTAEAVGDQEHEVVVSADADKLVVERAVLIVDAGPDAGRRKVLRRSRVSVGRSESDLSLTDVGVVAKHCHLRVSRGRVMVEPGNGAAFLDGQRVRSITPLYADETLSIGNTIVRVERDLDDEVPLARCFGLMVGDSRRMQQLFGVMRRMAGHHFPVLIGGESGTGKELAAAGIHEHSARGAGPFVPVNCGAISPALFESELFGHEKGAFTGAEKRKDGAFHAADGGTLFLDEVGELPAAAQAKLLRTLESGEVRRVGSNAVEHPDVRVVAATNRDLAEMVAEGHFRQDLFFRLNVLAVQLPPLRERLVELPLLCQTLCRGLHPEAHVTEDAIEALSTHTWPGNVRELRNVLTRAYVGAGVRIDASALSYHDLGHGAAKAAVGHGTLADAEKAYIVNMLRKNQDNRSATARELGIARSTLHHKMKRLGIS
jgi:DNA-binding NtrC family response regulator